MQCPVKSNQNFEILLDYCARKLGTPVMAAFERHLEGCPDCQSFTIAQQAAWEALDVWEPGPVSADFDRKLYARIEQHENSSWWNRLWHRAMWQPGFSGPAVPLATACATALLGVMLYLPANKAVTVMQGSSQTKIESSDIEQLEITLEDIDMFRQLAPAPASKS